MSTMKTQVGGRWASSWAKCLSALVPQCLLLVLTTAIAGEVSFSAKPMVAKEGDKVKITFAVSAPTDVAVFIEDAKGTVIRHLVAGVLGGTSAPPAPLKPGLAQEIEWDGRADYGKPAGPGPFKVRVGLGLGAKYDRVVSSRPMAFTGNLSLGVGPDGALYVLQAWNPSSWLHKALVVFNRDGTYRRTLFPYAATADNREAKGLDVMELAGQAVPVRQANNRVCDFYPYPFANGSLAISADGKALYAAGQLHDVAGAGVFRMDTAGGFPGGPYVTLDAAKYPTFCGGGIALSSDGRQLFLAGLADRIDHKPHLSAIYRVNVPDRTGLKVFFGEPSQPGNDETHLAVGTGGLASDGAGHLLVADSANDRVVVLSEADGKFVASFKVDRPGQLGVAAASGAVYVTSAGKAGNRLLKFSGWKDAKPVGELRIPWSSSMAVDASANPTVIWVVTRGDGIGNGGLIRIEDAGGKFESVVMCKGDQSSSGRMTNESYLGLTVDRFTKEVYVRNGLLTERFDDTTGKSETLPIGSLGGSGTGPCVFPTPSGDLYAIQWPAWIWRYDRSGKPQPWPDRRRPSDAQMLAAWEKRGDDKQRPNAAFVPVAMTELPHTLGVRWSDGHHFVLESKDGGRNWKAMYEYLPTSQRASDTPIIWKLSDAAVGPKFDAAGNIYVAEIVRPKGWKYPPEISSYVEKRNRPGLANVLAATYGSIVKFSPKGGMIHFAVDRIGPEPYDGTPKLDPSLKVSEVDYCWGGAQLNPVKITGAEWLHPGVGHVGWLNCNCENMTFDVDEFGRTFFPDFAMYQIRVIDTAGTAITNIGGYGNPENCGPESPVVDPKTGQVRPRRGDDPKELQSPFAKPDIAMAWPTGVGVTDRHLYIGDTVNRRLLRAKLVYTVEESCELK